VEASRVCSERKEKKRKKSQIQRAETKEILGGAYWVTNVVRASNSFKVLLGEVSAVLNVVDCVFSIAVSDLILQHLHLLSSNKCLICSLNAGLKISCGGTKKNRAKTNDL
jgi:hypothetical protein